MNIIGRFIVVTGERIYIELSCIIRKIKKFLQALLTFWAPMWKHSDFNIQYTISQRALELFPDYTSLITEYFGGFLIPPDQQRELIFALLNDIWIQQVHIIIRHASIFLFSRRSLISTGDKFVLYVWNWFPCYPKIDKSHQKDFL